MTQAREPGPPHKAPITKRTILTMATLLAMSSTAHAVPTLSFRAFQDNVLQGALSTSSTTGTLTVTGATPLFNVVTAFASGIGAVAAPSLVAQTTQISTNPGFSGTHSMRVECTQTDVPSLSAGGLLARLASTLFSETIIISALFTGGGAALNASSQIVAVPEPASLALFGGALLGPGAAAPQSPAGTQFGLRLPG